MSKHPLIRIIVITYNHIYYIKQCLDGLLMQRTRFNYEIIIGDEESSDGTTEVCIDYSNKFLNKINLILRSRENVRIYFDSAESFPVNSTASR